MIPDPNLTELGLFHVKQEILFHVKHGSSGHYNTD
jgi:hypothetical protein